MISRNAYLLVLILAFLSSCKTASRSSQKSVGILSGDRDVSACLAWYQGEDVYYKHCSLGAECQATDGVKAMSRTAHENYLKVVFGLTDEQKSKVDESIGDIDKILATYDLKINAATQATPGRSATLALEEIEKSKFSMQQKKLEIELFKSTLQERENAYAQVIAEVSNPEMINWKLSSIPGSVIALRPILGANMDACFSPQSQIDVYENNPGTKVERARLLAEAVAKFEAKNREWEEYIRWVRQPPGRPICLTLLNRSVVLEWRNSRLRAPMSSENNCMEVSNTIRDQKLSLICGSTQKVGEYYLTSDGSKISVAGESPSESVIYYNDCMKNIAASNQLINDPELARKFLLVNRTNNSYDLVSLWNNTVVKSGISATSGGLTNDIRSFIPVKPDKSQFVVATNEQSGSGQQNSASPQNSGSNSNSRNPKVDDIVSHMQDAKREFNKVQPLTRDACLKVTPPEWSDLMAHYYCQFPVEVDGVFCSR